MDTGCSHTNIRWPVVPSTTSLLSCLWCCCCWIGVPHTHTHTQSASERVCALIVCTIRRCMRACLPACRSTCLWLTTHRLSITPSLSAQQRRHTPNNAHLHIHPYIPQRAHEGGGPGRGADLGGVGHLDGGRVLAGEDGPAVGGWIGWDEMGIYRWNTVCTWYT